MKKTLLFMLAGLTGHCCFAQPFTKNYIMVFHTCDASCTGFQDHMVNLAESNDGTNWTIVPNFVPYQGSVPDATIRGNKLYVYTPGKVKRYDNASGLWETNPVNVSVLDQGGNPVNYVDPSPILDSAGNIVLFFLNSTGVTGDPAGCQAYPCTKYFDSAVEVNGSDGTQFVMQSGDRKSVLLSSAPQTASDPDIYFDGANYILYISKGSSTVAFQSNSMHGSYTSFPNLSGDILTSQGGIPCGHYDPGSATYRTYVHANVSGNTVIRQAVHSDFNSQLANLSTVISGPLIGQPSSTKTESPGFFVNDFLTGIYESENKINVEIFPNPFCKSTTLLITDAHTVNYGLNIYDVLGNVVLKKTGTAKQSTLDLDLENGVYFLQIIPIAAGTGKAGSNKPSGWGTTVKKLIIFR